MLYKEITFLIKIHFDCNPDPDCVLYSFNRVDKITETKALIIPL